MNISPGPRIIIRNEIAPESLMERPRERRPMPQVLAVYARRAMLRVPQATTAIFRAADHTSVADRRVARGSRTPLSRLYYGVDARRPCVSGPPVIRQINCMANI